jgi:hypothetical protein
LKGNKEITPLVQGMNETKKRQPVEPAGQSQPAVLAGLKGDSQAEYKENQAINKKE